MHIIFFDVTHNRNGLPGILGAFILIFAGHWSKIWAEIKILLGGYVMNVLVTGGAGYIGSHTCLELLESGYGVVVIDNLCNSNSKSLERVQQLTGKSLKFYEGDVRDEGLLRKIFSENEIGCVIHFAGLKAVGESVAKPWEYYDNNLNSTLVLTKVMKEAGMKRIIFSSSATVYTCLLYTSPSPRDS